MKHQVPDAERCIYATRQKDFVLWHNLLYLKITPKRSNEDVLVFVVLGLKRQAAIDGCHRYLGHQGRDHTLSLLRERFWWPGKAQRMMLSIWNCEKCRIFEAKPQIPPHGTHPLYWAIVFGTHRLRVHGGNSGHQGKTSRQECLGRRGPFYMLYSGVCHQQPYCTHDGMHFTMSFFRCLGSLDDWCLTRHLSSRGKLYQSCVIFWALPRSGHRPTIRRPTVPSKEYIRHSEEW